MSGYSSSGGNSSMSVIADAIADTLQTSVQIDRVDSVGGGCINQASRIVDTAGNSWFVKENGRHLLDMFIAEAMGLQEIQQSNSIRAPEVVCYGETERSAYLVLEYIPMQGTSGDATSGEKLAQMHAYHHPQYGWYRDNTIGATPQRNQQSPSWIEFWRNQRLMAQLDMAKRKGYPMFAYENGLKLAENLGVFFENYKPAASLLHGDLWGGNHALDAQGNPVIFDPAVYFGDRETDIAMTELFGGFSASFYAAYNACSPLDKGYSVRKKLYNLYHVLNHFNLFGGGYASQAANMTQDLLAEI